jgi:hypothetical protein
MIKTPAPILLFTYNRLQILEKCVSALGKNKGAEESDLYIFSDGPKSEKDELQVDRTRSYMKTITGFKSVHLFCAETNKGLAKSIIDGVTEIINKYDKVIVLEDDLVTSSNFLSYMNQALEYYSNNPKIFSISGFSIPIAGLNKEEVYFTQRASSWGWATWKERWNPIDWEVKDFDSFSKDSSARKNFNKMGSDMSSMLEKQIKGEINSWAIRWCYHQFRNNLYTVFPAVSKVENIGFNNEATHTKDKFNRFITFLDNTGSVNFHFSNDIRLQKSIIAQFVKPYSLMQRIKFKLLNALSIK